MPYTTSGKIPRRPPRRFKPPRPGQPPGDTSTPPKAPPAPPAPDRPTRDSSRKSFPKRSRNFVLWGFVKHKWQSLDKWDQETFQFFGLIFWFLFWFFSALLAGKGVIIFIIPWTILTVIGMFAFIAIIKHLVKRAWNKYFPEYQEFKQEYKPKRKTNDKQMDSISDLFEDYEDIDRERGTEHTTGGG